MQNFILRFFICILVVPISFYFGVFCRMPLALSRSTVVDFYFSYEDKCQIRIKKNLDRFFMGTVNYKIDIVELGNHRDTLTCGISSEALIFLGFDERGPTVHYFSYSDVKETMGCLSFEKLGEFDSEDIFLGKPHVFKL